MGTNPGASQSSHFADEQKRGDSSQAWGGGGGGRGKPGFSARSRDGTGERGDLSRGQENPGSLDC